MIRFLGAVNARRTLAVMDSSGYCDAICPVNSLVTFYPWRLASAGGRCVGSSPTSDPLWIYLDFTWQIVDNSCVPLRERKMNRRFRLLTGAFQSLGRNRSPVPETMAIYECHFRSLFW